MTSRAPKCCAEVGCTAIVGGGGNRCPEHVNRQPWARHGVDRSDTAARRRMKARVFRRCGGRCEIGDTGCTGAAAEVDRINSMLGYVDSNVQGCCRNCHAKKTSREGNLAQGNRVSPPTNAGSTTPTNASSTRQSDGVGVPRRIVIW